MALFGRSPFDPGLAKPHQRYILAVAQNCAACLRQSCVPLAEPSLPGHPPRSIRIVSVRGRTRNGAANAKMGSMGAGRASASCLLAPLRRRWPGVKVALLRPSPSRRELGRNGEKRCDINPTHAVPVRGVHAAAESFPSRPYEAAPALHSRGGGSVAARCSLPASVVCVTDGAVPARPPAALSIARRESGILVTFSEST